MIAVHWYGSEGGGIHTIQFVVNSKILEYRTDCYDVLDRVIEVKRISSGKALALAKKKMKFVKTINIGRMTI
jgi:hypothetical protein